MSMIGRSRDEPLWNVMRTVCLNEAVQDHLSVSPGTYPHHPVSLGTYSRHAERILPLPTHVAGPLVILLCAASSGLMYLPGRRTSAARLSVCLFASFIVWLCGNAVGGWAVRYVCMYCCFRVPNRTASELSSRMVGVAAANLVLQRVRNIHWW